MNDITNHRCQIKSSSVNYAAFPRLHYIFNYNYNINYRRCLHMSAHGRISCLLVICIQIGFIRLSGNTVVLSFLRLYYLSKKGLLLQMLKSHLSLNLDLVQNLRTDNEILHFTEVWV